MIFSISSREFLYGSWLVKELIHNPDEQLCLLCTVTVHIFQATGHTLHMVPSLAESNSHSGRSGLTKIWEAGRPRPQ